jgi:hypothetical protein
MPTAIQTTLAIGVISDHFWAPYVTEKKLEAKLQGWFAFADDPHFLKDWQLAEMGRIPAS